VFVQTDLVVGKNRVSQLERDRTDQRAGRFFFASPHHEGPFGDGKKGV